MTTKKKEDENGEEELKQPARKTHVETDHEALEKRVSEAERRITSLEQKLEKQA